ncbi:translation initiation factor IF-1 [Fimbriiglobus ruber]|uniref:translation initiation factor IF-1 n=1 Tax=Fimbriiglobus ruber TaxID=1908690 RepID=UPI000B4B9320
MDEELYAVIQECLPCTHFTVELKSGQRLRVSLARRVVHKRNIPRLLPGDEVTVEISPFDPGIGRIIGLRPPANNSNC